MNKLFEIITIINNHLATIKSNYRLNYIETYNNNKHCIKIELSEINVVLNTYSFFIMESNTNSDEQLFKDVCYTEFIKNIVFSRATNNKLVNPITNKTMMSFRDIINKATNNE